MSPASTKDRSDAGIRSISALPRAERTFVDDLSVPGMFHAVVVRSPVAKGKLLGIETPRLTHGGILIRASDIPGENRLEAFGNSVPILALNEVHYIGEPVAILVGPDRSTLEKTARACVVSVAEETPDLYFEKFSSDRVAAKRTATIGDPDAAFKTAAQVIEGTYRTGRQEHWYAEPHGALAGFAYDKMEIAVATQWPFHVRRTVSGVLDVRAEDIVVECCEVGVHLDGKLWYPSLVAAHAALAALICRKPVKLMLTREEDARYSPKRPQAIFHHRAALGEGGELTALEARVVMDIGATGPFAEETLDRMCLGSLGTYRCPNIRVEGFAVRTNSLPSSPFAGFGLSNGFFAIENHVSRLAAAIGQDPIEWRKANSLRQGDVLASGLPLKEPVPADELMDAVIAMSDYRRKWAAYELLKHGREGKKDSPLRGIGIAYAYQGNGFLSNGPASNYAVELELYKDGILEIRTSAVSGSHETAALWRHVAAETLALKDSEVRLAENRSDLVPDSGPSSLSRNIVIITKLIERCCLVIRKQRFRDPLPITVRRVHKAPRSQGWSGLRMEGNPASLFSWAAAIVEVEIDQILYIPKVRGVWLCVDGGRILSDRKARSSLENSVLHALGWVRQEQVHFDAGGAPGVSILSYDVASPGEAPPIVVDFSWNESTVPKGIGELPFGCVPPAYAQAVSQASGIDFDALPLDPQALRDALEET